MRSDISNEIVHTGSTAQQSEYSSALGGVIADLTDLYGINPYLEKRNHWCQSYRYVVPDWGFEASGQYAAGNPESIDKAAGSLERIGGSVLWVSRPRTAVAQSRKYQPRKLMRGRVDMPYAIVGQKEHAGTFGKGLTTLIGAPIYGEAIASDAADEDIEGLPPTDRTKGPDDLIHSHSILMMGVSASPQKHVITKTDHLAKITMGTETIERIGGISGGATTGGFSETDLAGMNDESNAKYRLTSAIGDRRIRQTRGVLRSNRARVTNIALSEITPQVEEEFRIGPTILQVVEAVSADREILEYLQAEITALPETFADKLLNS